MLILSPVLPSFPRRRASSDCIQDALGVVLAFARELFNDWIPACAGMTV